jgi:hypothetical protein
VTEGWDDSGYTKIRGQVVFNGDGGEIRGGRIHIEGSTRQYENGDNGYEDKLNQVQYTGNDSQDQYNLNHNNYDKSEQEYIYDDGNDEYKVNLLPNPNPKPALTPSHQPHSFEGLLERFKRRLLSKDGTRTTAESFGIYKYVYLCVFI